MMNDPSGDQLHAPLLDRVLFALLTAVLLFTPLALGTVQPWSEQVFVCLGLVIAVVSLVRVLALPDSGRLSRWAAVPLVGFPLLVAIQLVPWLPLVRWISPEAAAARAGVASLTTAALPAFETISLNADETLRGLRLLLGVLAVFLGAWLIAGRRSMVRGLLIVMMLAGLLVAGVAAAHVLLGIDRVYGVVVRPPRAGETSAPFINRNHFAQFLNMSIGASMALLLKGVWKASQVHSLRKPKDWVEALQQGALHPTLLPLVALGFCAAMVILCGSRGGVLGLLLGALVTAIATARRRSARPVAIALCAAIIIACLIAAAVSTRLQERLVALTGPDADGGRLELLKAQVPMWKMFPWTGTGLNTFESVFGQFDAFTRFSISTHAENDYAQMLTETGLAGWVLMACFIGAVAHAAIRLIRAGGHRGLIATGLCFGLVAIAVQSALDFGQRLPANAAITAVVVAMLLRMNDGEPDDASPEAAARGGWGGAGLVAVLATALALAAWDADNYRRSANSASQSTGIADRLARDNGQGTQAEYDTMLAAADRAAALRPISARAHYALGFARFLSAQREAKARFDPAADARAIDASLAAFNRAMKLTPWHGPPFIMAGQILFEAGDRQRGGALIETAARLAPQDGWAQALAGEVALARGDERLAMYRFRRAVNSTGVGSDYVLNRLLREYDRFDLALDFADGDVHQLAQIAGEMKQRNRPTEEGVARDRQLTAALRLADLPEARAGALAIAAELLWRAGRSAEAVPYWYRAVALEPAAHGWRMSLARALIDQGDLAAAETQLRAVVRDRPDDVTARQLAADIRLRAATQPAR